MNDQEISNIFMGALIVILLQAATISLIMYYEITTPSFKIIPSDSFTIILARLFASMMMHLNVEPEIRSGINLAKYLVNHPSRFKGATYVDSDG